ncbi:MAG: discoidin domain-containing protein, partial [Phenylobacterium sp.]|uniref:galactose-binding domain-containing protein n=1 Tax=Phenylobacterium sp. TaxID=1871053 RepID=UPI003BB6CC82
MAAGPIGAQTTTNYTYDPLGRLVSAIDSDGKTVAYSYDRAGNRTRLSNDQIYAEIIPTAYSASTTASTTGLGAGLRDGAFVGAASIHITQSEAQPWVMVDLGAAKNIDHVNLAAANASGIGPANLNDADVEHSLNGTTWSSAGTLTGVVA